MMNPRKTHAHAAQLVLALAVIGTTAHAEKLSLEAPPSAKAPGAANKTINIPARSALSGPLANAGIGKLLMQSEADPPPTTRGAGGSGLERLFAARCRSVVLVIAIEKKGSEFVEGGSGTGSIVSMDGHILTAAHVMGNNEVAAIGVFPSCKPGTKPESFVARVVRRDPVKDLALLQFTDLPSDIAIMPLGQLDEVRTGSNVVMIGHPRKLYMSLSQGSVSAIRPDFEWDKSRATVVQTDGALNPGNSGGPMMSAEGNLIGVNSFIYGDASAGLNFAVSVADVRDFLSGQNTATAPAPAESKSENTAKAKCDAKELKKWREDGATMILYDANCSGKGDALYVIPDDKKQLSWIGFDRNGDDKIDAKVTLNSKDEEIASLWDDDYDGTWDFRGEYSGGEITRKVPL